MSFPSFVIPAGAGIQRDKRAKRRPEGGAFQLLGENNLFAPIGARHLRAYLVLGNGSEQGDRAMKFEGFHVTNFRNVLDSGWITANRITAFVGQNEAGKSNLFEALYCLNPIIEEADYDLNEDWPVDNWEGRKDADGEQVCFARFRLSSMKSRPSRPPLPQKVRKVERARFPPLRGGNYLRMFRSK